MKSSSSREVAFAESREQVRVRQADTGEETAQSRRPKSVCLVGTDGGSPVSYTHLDVYKRQIHNTPDATASGTVTPEIRLVIALADATTAGCISAEPALPPTAAIIVSSIGSSPCIPARCV